MASKFGGIAVKKSRFGGVAAPALSDDVPDIDLSQPEQIAGPAQPRPQSGREQLTGAVDLAGAAGNAMGKEFLKGIGVVGGLINPFKSGEQAISDTEAFINTLPNFEVGREGQRLLQILGDEFKDSPEIVQRVIKAAGSMGQDFSEKTFEATGSPFLAAAAGTVPGAVEAATGIKGARVAAGALEQPLKQVGQAAEAVESTALRAPDVVEDIFTFQTPTKKRVAELIREGSIDSETATSMISPRGNLVNDPVAAEAAKQGFDEGIIASAKNAGPDDKAAFREMARIMERAKADVEFRATNRPSDVLGNSVMTRVKIVARANRIAGGEIDRVAESLKGQRADFLPATENFIENLESMGITLNRKDGIVTADFKLSDIEGLAGPENVINRMVKRMMGDSPPDAFEGHRLKRFIDEQVTIGKSAEGLAGKTERVLKDLRFDLDDILDTSFPEYNRINTAYSETIQALDAFQDVAGRKMNLKGKNAEKSTGTLMRRTLSNAPSRITLLDSVNDIEAIAKKYEHFKGTLRNPDPTKIEGPNPPSKIKGNLLKQVLYVDELDAQFGTLARTSLQGQVQQGVSQAATFAVSPVAGTIRAGGKLAEKAQGINDKNAFKALRDLLK